MSGFSMYKTKLCIMFSKNGQCSRPNCSFAHGNAELRRPGESSFTGRHPNMDNDLRDKIGRRLSLERRPSSDRGGPSSDRSGRRLPRFSGHDNSRPFEKRMDKDYRETYKFDERSDYAGGLKVGNRAEDRVEDERKKFPSYNGATEDQLKDIELDIKMLSEDKLRLEASFERKAQEVDILSSRIKELETQLDREREECRSVTSNMKKFVKEYNRYLRAQDDVKRSQARLQKLGSQITMYLVGNDDNDRDADIDIMSDEENNARNLRPPPNEFQNTSFLSRKRHHVDQYTNKVASEDAMIGRGEGDKLDAGKKHSRWNRVSSKSYSEEEGGGWNDDTISNHPSSRDDKWKRRRFSSGNPATDKVQHGSGLVMSSTSMAAQADDEVAEIDEEDEEEEEEAAVKADDTSETKGSPFTSLPPPPISRDNTHFQGDEEDENDGEMEDRKTDNVDSI